MCSVLVAASQPILCTEHKVERDVAHRSVTVCEENIAKTNSFLCV